MSSKMSTWRSTWSETSKVSALKIMSRRTRFPRCGGSRRTCLPSCLSRESCHTCLPRVFTGGSQNTFSQDCLSVGSQHTCHPRRSSMGSRSSPKTLVARIVVEVQVIQGVPREDRDVHVTKSPVRMITTYMSPRRSSGILGRTQPRHPSGGSHGICDPGR